ncbi:MAG TPA: hypothetical protein DCS66_04860 [Flavobacteriaceae bacterium]|nr:hypothetical protein [Flavobacteriaceae bacterium]
MNANNIEKIAIFYSKLYSSSLSVRALLALVIFCACPLLSQASSMKEFISYVSRTNPAILSAQSEVAKADANYAQSRRPIYNPSLDVDAERVNQESFEDTYTAGINQTVDLFNKRGANAAVGQHGLAEAKANLLAEQLNVTTQALKALAKYRTAQSVVNLAKQRTQLLAEFKKQNVRKFKSGDIAQDALDQASLAYAHAISQQADEEIILMNAYQNLIAITHTSPNTWPIMPDKLPTPLRISIAKQEEWLRKLPVIEIYGAKVATAKAVIRVAQAETKPDPTIGFRGGTEDNELLIGGSLSIPLFVRNNFEDQVHAANHQAIAVEQEQMNIYRQNKARLQGDLSKYNTLYNAAGQWSQASKHSLDGGIDLLNRLWSAGELNTTDYLVQLKQRIDSQISGVELTGKTWQMWFSVMEASGQLKTWIDKT